ncbi:MAG: DUF6672 family protein [Sphaerochaeta sp.]|jgi:hypothetical protein|uniref:DUF6672 family protein n=1 Tax=Sphaerochaeta sp. TaxID=1972642 RepID=UPI002FC8A6F8
MNLKINRTFWIRLIAILVILLFSVFLFFIGRQHTVLLDNKTVTVQGAELKALQLVEVQVNKEPSLELAARDRDQALVTAQKHRVTVTYTDTNWEEHTITRSFKIPLMQNMVMILIPALVADPQSDQSVWLQNYEPPTAAQLAPADEQVVTDDLAGLITTI